MSRRHRTLPAVSVMSRGHRTLPAASVMSRCHRTLPVVSVMSRGHTTLPAVALYVEYNFSSFVLDDDTGLQAKHPFSREGGGYVLLVFHFIHSYFSRRIGFCTIKMTRLLAGAVALLFCCAIIPNGARAACPGTYVELGGKCYYFFNNDPQTFLGARQVCQNLIGGDLAVLEDCNDHRLIADHIKNNPSEEVPEGYWIGGSDIIQDGQFLWIEGESVPMGAPFWGRSADSPGEPSGGDSANCAFMATGEGFYFHDNDCEEPEGLAPLCQIDTVAVCPEYYDAIAGSCFQFLPLLEETWEDARYICQASAGDLAIVDDCNVMSSIINFIQNLDEPLPIKGFWIGATDAVSEGNWLWVNNATVAMGVPFWGSEGSGPLQPDDQFATQNCLELWARDRYYFNDVECSPTEGRAPLCETNPI